MGDRERDNVVSAVMGVLERFGGVVEPFRAEALRKLKHETIWDGESCQLQGLSILRLRAGREETLPSIPLRPAPRRIVGSAKHSYEEDNHA